MPNRTLSPRTSTIITVISSLMMTDSFFLRVKTSMLALRIQSVHGWCRSDFDGSKSLQAIEKPHTIS